MRLNKTLFIGENQVPVASDDIVLNEHAPGKAIFTIVYESSNESKGSGDSYAPSGIVVFRMGYAGDKTYQYFIGYIETAIKQSSSSWQIHCSELSNALQIDSPISLIHCTLHDVLTEISNVTNLNFIVPEKAYATKKVPRFYNTGSGLDAVKRIGDIFEIENYVWQQQGDGTIYVGSWDDSYWAEKPINIDEQFYIKAQGNSATLPSIPAIRPGCILNDRRITKVHNSANKMMVTYA